MKENKQELHSTEPTNQSGPLLRFSKDVKIGADPTELGYLKVPVSDFGTTLLRKMGWVEGQGIGRNGKKGLAQPIEYIPRYNRLGLGSTPLSTMKIMGRPNNLLGNHEKGELQSTNYKYLDEKIKYKHSPGTEIIVNRGKYDGMYGRVLGFYQDSKTILYIELLANDQKVKIPKDHVSIVDSTNKQRQENQPNEKQYKHRKKQKLRWIFPGILVRIISKEYAGGKYYNKKVTVEDVPDKRNFTLVTEEGNLLEDLIEDDIETVMPHLMGDVMILKGSNRGELGKLLMRDKKKNIIQVQLYDNPEILLELTQDDCSALSNRKFY